MKNMDPRLLNECLEKLIIVKLIDKKLELPDVKIYAEFIDTINQYNKLTNDYNQALRIAESIRIKIRHFEPKVRDTKERTRGALMLHFGKQSHEYLTYMRSSEYAKFLAREKRKAKKQKNIEDKPSDNNM